MTTTKPRLSIAAAVLTVPAIDLPATASSMCEWEASFGNGEGIVWRFKDGSTLRYTRATREWHAGEATATPAATH